MLLSTEIDGGEKSERQCSMCLKKTKTITIYGQNKNPVLTFCKSCLLSMVDKFQPSKDYSNHGGIYPF